MPRIRPIVPPLKRHKPSGRAYATIDGRRVYFGPFDDPVSERRYKRHIAERMDAESFASPPDPKRLTVAELVAAFMRHAATYYRLDDGTVTNELANFTKAVKPLVELYADVKAADFGPLALKAVRQTMVDKGWCRSQVNKQTSRLKHVFRWGGAEELIEPSVFHRLQCVGGLRYGRSAAKESEPVKPVPDHIVDATLPHMTPTVRAMVELLRTTGMRAGELVLLRTADLDTSGSVWTYTPQRHKSQHHGRTRKVFIGPRGQAVLKPFLRHDLQAYVFSPEQADAERRERMHAARRTPLSCGNRPGTNVKADPKKQPGDRYTTGSLGHAVEYACRAAWPPPKGTTGDELRQWRRDHRWNLHQLRHSYATTVRREHGLEAAQVLLGHSRADVTQVYAERDSAKAIEVARRIG